MDYLKLNRMPEGQALIYRIVNKENGNMYVGSTIEPRRRLRQHFKELRENRHHSFILQRAFDTHSENILWRTTYEL